jgi:hypothetical protein
MENLGATSCNLDGVYMTRHLLTTKKPDQPIYESFVENVDVIVGLLEQGKGGTLY